MCNHRLLNVIINAPVTGMSRSFKLTLHDRLILQHVPDQPPAIFFGELPKRYQQWSSIRIMNAAGLQHKVFRARCRALLREGLIKQHKILFGPSLYWKTPQQETTIKSVGKNGTSATRIKPKK